MTKALIAVLGTLGLIFALSGCGSTCSSACDKIYNECELSFDNTSESECVDECEKIDDSEEKDDGIDCVMKASCDVYELSNCLM